MSLWSLTSPPTWAPDALATNDGWEMPDTPEILVAIPQLVTRNGGVRAKTAAVQLLFSQPTYSATNSDPIEMALVFPENVILNTLQTKYFLSIGLYFLGSNNVQSGAFGPTGTFNVQDVEPAFYIGDTSIPTAPTNALIFGYTLSTSDIGSTLSLGSPVYDSNQETLDYTNTLFWNWDVISSNTSGVTDNPTITGVNSNRNYYNLLVSDILVPVIPTLT